MQYWYPSAVFSFSFALSLGDLCQEGIRRRFVVASWDRCAQVTFVQRCELKETGGSRIDTHKNYINTRHPAQTTRPSPAGPDACPRPHTQTARANFAAGEDENFSPGGVRRFLWRCARCQWMRELAMSCSTFWWLSTINGGVAGATCALRCRCRSWGRRGRVGEGRFCLGRRAGRFYPVRRTLQRCRRFPGSAGIC